MARRRRNRIAKTSETVAEMKEPHANASNGSTKLGLKAKSKSTTKAKTEKMKMADEHDEGIDGSQTQRQSYAKSNEEETSKVGNRNSGRSAKKQAMKKMAGMNDEIEITDDEDDNFEDGDDDDSDDMDDFEVSPSLKVATKRRKEKAKMDISDRGSTPRVMEENSVGPAKIVERYCICSQASQEAFLSLSESDSSSDEDEELHKKPAEESIISDNNLKPKSIFDDLAPSSPLRNDEPPENSPSFKDDTGSLKSSNSQESGKKQELSFSTTPSATYSPYFTPQSAQPKPIENSTMSGLSESEGSHDGCVKDLDLEKLAPVVQQKQVKRNRGRKKAMKVKSAVEMESDEELEEAKHKSAPPTSRKRGRVPSLPATSEQNIIQADSKKKRGAKVEQGAKQSPAKRRKMVLKVEKLDVSTVEGAGKKRGRIRQKKGAKMPKDEEEIRIKEEVHCDEAEMSSDDSHSDWEEVEGERLYFT